MGQQILDELTNEDRPDITIRWVSHYLADLLLQDDPNKDLRREATDLILRLWEHRYHWPTGWPPARLENAFRWMQRDVGTIPRGLDVWADRLRTIRNSLDEEYAAWLAVALADEQLSQDDLAALGDCDLFFDANDRTMIGVLLSIRGRALQLEADQADRKENSDATSVEVIKTLHANRIEQLREWRSGSI